MLGPLCHSLALVPWLRILKSLPGASADLLHQPGLIHTRPFPVPEKPPRT